MKQITKVILVNSDKKLLLVLRDNKKEISCPNQGVEIGGAVEQRETILRALNQEIKEETICNVNPSHLLETPETLFLMLMFSITGEDFQKSWGIHG